MFKRIFALSLALLTVCVTSTACGKTPIETIENGTVNLVENICEDYSVIRTLSDALRGGSVQVNLAIDDIIEDAPINGADGSVTVYFGEQDMAVNAAAKLNGVSIGDATLYLDKQGIAVSSDAFLGSGKAYGSDYDGIDERFEDSIFNGDGKFGALEEPLGMVVEYLALAGRSFAAADDLKILWNELKGDIYEAVESNASASVEKGTYTANGKSVKTHNVVISVKDDQICDTAIAVIDVLLASDKFQSFCRIHDDYLEEMVEIMGLSEDFKDLPKALESLKEELDDNNDEMYGNELEIKAYVGRSSKELLALEVAFDDGSEDDLNITFICTPSSDMLETATLIVEEGKNKSEFTYAVKEDTKNSYKSKFTVRNKGESYYNGEEYDDQETVFEYSWNKASGDFKLKIVDEIDITGKIESGKKTSVVRIEKLKGNGQDIEFKKFEIVIKASDNMPVIDKYDDIMKISESDFEKIYNDVIDLFKNALNK